MQTFFYLFSLWAMFFAPITTKKLDAERFLQIQTQKSGWANWNRATNFYVKSEGYSMFNSSTPSVYKTHIYKLPYQSYQMDSTKTGTRIQIDNGTEQHTKSMSGKWSYLNQYKAYLMLPSFAFEPRIQSIIEEEGSENVSLTEEVFQNKPVYKITLSGEYQVFPLQFYYDKETFNLIADQNGYNYNFYEG